MNQVRNPWIVAITVTLATFMELLDTSIANVSLPHIAGGLSTTQDEATWVLTSYLVSNAIILPLSAWLSRVFGRKNYYMACVALFTISSFLCGTATSLSELIFFRVVQGIGGGGLAPVEQAILVDTFPPSKRAAAFGLYSMAIVTAPALGPPLGGWITDNFSWRWVFFINLPIGLLSLLLTSRLVQDPPAFKEEAMEARRGGKLRIDVLGILLLAVGFGCLEVVLDRGQTEDWLGSPFIVKFLTVGAISLVLALWWELFYSDPVVEIRLLKNRNFALACSFYFIFGFVLFGSTVMIPEILESLYRYDATNAGLVLGPGAMVIVILAPFVVRTWAKVGAGNYILAGFTILGGSMMHFSHMSLEADYSSFMWARALQGLGLACLFVPVSQVAYSYLPANKNNKASSLTNLFRNQGGSFGIAFVTTMLARRAQFHQQVLGSHITTGNPHLTEASAAQVQALVAGGLGEMQAQVASTAQLYKLVLQQANFLAFMDCFHLLGCVALAGVPLALMIRGFGKPAAGGEPAH